MSPAAAVVPAGGAAVVTVVPSVAGLAKEFDYLVPDHLAATVRVGSVVRVDLAGRRVAGWVVSEGVGDPGGRALRPLVRVSGWGPEPGVVDLASWAAWRWAGRRRALLSTATHDRAVPDLPPARRRPPAPPGPGSVPEGLADTTAAQGGEGEWSTLVVRLPPAFDVTATVAQVAQRGPTLVVVPSAERAAVLADRLRRAGGDVALLPGEWAQARAGAAVVVGTRAAAWGPCPDLAAVVVVDGHDEALVQEQAPTWSAVGVATERARRAGVPCVVTTPCPPVELLAQARLVAVAPDVERSGWSVLDIVDRRSSDPREGLWSRTVVDAARSGERVAVVLDRVGRARLVVCAVCGGAADCERCGAAVAWVDAASLTCPRCALSRPMVCRACGSTRLRRLRTGVTRAREELEALVGRPVGELTAAASLDPTAGVVVGTSALLHRVGTVDVVAFLDFDQHLLASRHRAADEALALLAAASRLTGGRRRHPRGRVLVQTRRPDHVVLQAVSVADPARVAAHEAVVRVALGLPPASALAEVSGPVAATWVEALIRHGGAVDVTGPLEGRWLVRATDAATLADALASVPRPTGRMRVEVDPLRV